MDNCTSAASILLAKLKVGHTKQNLEDSILSHPEYPSLLAISDTMSKYRIENLPVKVDGQKLKELPLPCIVQLSDKGGMFHVLVHYSEEWSVYLNDRGKQVKIPTKDFLKKWTGICLLVETTPHSGEVDIEKKLAERKTMAVFKWGAGLSLLIWAVWSFLNSPFMQESGSLFLAGYTLLKLIGLTMGVMLLWYEVDKYNPTLQSFCLGSKKVNCDSVLSSKYAKVLNGKLSLGLLGFTYFFATLVFLLINGFSSATLMPLAYLSFAGLPMVVISAYYQGLVIKQWCKFCVVVQVVLLMEAAAVFLGGSHLFRTEINSLPLLMALILMPIPIWKWLKSLLENKKEVNLHKRNLKKIKNNQNVLEGLLTRTRKIENSTEGLGISLHAENVKYNIIEVCNPYCVPCARAHPVLEELTRAKKINLQIMFTASMEKDDFTTKPVKHFLAIASKGDKKVIQKALDDWYLSENKNYDAFTNKYPMNGELERQNGKIEAMRHWCDVEKITKTPTIFINGHELPKEYNIEDLKEVLF
jgi:uncharacterized membrane protein